MKVLYITNMYPNIHKNWPYTGVFVKEQIEAVQSSSLKVSIDIFILDGIKSKLNYLKSVWQIRQRIKKFNPDVIHVHYGLSGLFLLIFPHYKRKSIITLHGGDIMPQQKKWVQNFLTRLILRGVAKVIVLNQEMQTIVVKINPNCTELKCGVNFELFRCSEKRESKKKTIIFPADPQRVVKNYALFEKSVRYVDENSDYDLDVIILHNMSREEIVKILCSADCMLLTSISEGSPQVVKEAMACNLPVVSVNVGDIQENMLGLSNNYVVDVYDVKELGKSVLTVLSKGRVSRGRERLKALELDNNSIAKKLIDIYTDVTQSNKLRSD